jgi:hypothetical protein
MISSSVELKHDVLGALSLLELAALHIMEFHILANPIEHQQSVMFAEHGPPPILE